MRTGQAKEVNVITGESTEMKSSHVLFLKTPVK